MILFGDLLLNDMGGTPPPPLAKAMAVIGGFLHPTFDIFYRDGDSLDSCILVSAVLRDFLFRIGFVDAEVRSVRFCIQRLSPDKPARQLLIGEPGKADTHEKWNGHMVVVMPKTGWLIDATLYNARREHWPFLTGVVATPLVDPGLTRDGRAVLAGFAAKQDDDMVDASWSDASENTRWRSAPAIIRGGRRERARRAVADEMIRIWKGSKA